MVEQNSRLKILVIGAGGLLGGEVCRLLSGGPYDIKGMFHSELDITRGMDVSICMERLQPDVVINCAALSNVDYCEEHPGDAYRVNAEGVKNVCMPMVEDVHARFIHISTDYVFDGRKGEPYVEADHVNPVNHYGESKLKGEEYVQKLLSDAVILRVQWLFGEHGSGFASTLIRDVTKKRSLKRYCLLEDRIGNPTSVTEIARGIEALILKNKIRGLFHFAARGECSWVKFGKSIFELNGIEKSDRYIQYVKSEDLKRPAERPSYTAFSVARFEQEVGYVVQPWEIQLKEVILNLKNGEKKDLENILP